MSGCLDGTPLARSDRTHYIWNVTPSPDLALRPKSAELFARAKDLIPGGVNSPVRAFRGVGGEPFFVTRAEGAHIFDLDGREYVDFVGTWGPAILGHAPAVVVEAVREAAGRGLSFGIPNPDEVEMARTICEWVPSIKKVRMVNSGTEATMSCVRLARGFTGRDRIIKFEGCYHGHVDSLLVKAGSGALTHGRPDSAGVPAALAELTLTLPFNDEAAVRAVFEREGDEIAAVILEPIPANAGLYFAREGFLETLRELCTQYGALLIFDEVMTGFRVAKGGAQEIYGITPDLTALGKVIGGGSAGRARSAAGPRSWTSSRRMARSTRPVRFRVTRWRWRRGWRNCVNWSARMPGRAWRKSARSSRRRCEAALKRAGKALHVQPHRLDVLPVLHGRARCSTCDPRRPATGRRSRGSSTRAWTAGCTSRRRSSRPASSPPRTPPPT